MKSNVYSVKELVELNILDKPLDGNHGGIHPKGDDFKKEGIPFIMASDIKNGELDLVNCKFITYEQAELLKKGKAKENDVLITHKATIGRTAIVPPIPYPYIVLSPQVTYYRILKNDVLSPYYLYTYFNSLHFQSLINTWAGGGFTRLYIGVTAQLKLPIEVPNIHEQKKMTKILTYLDKKITLNNSVVKNLEEISQTFFKHWFTNFEFPNEQGEPYKSSGGEMVESELGEIPKGWNIEKLSNVCEVKDGTHDSPKQVEHGYPLVTSKHLRNHEIDFSTTKLISEEDFIKVNKRSLVETQDILISMIGTVGRLYFVQGENINYAIKNIGLIKSSQTDIAEYIYMYFKSPFMINHIKERMTGSTQQYISLTELRKIPVILPKEDILSRYSALIKPNFDMIFS
ncbi:restriction endonuclease subunit S [Bacillus paranthracis]|uniref:restriction endonuclease subunit S n=1 Tax=Bacillus paranthracis TaxID=2026186 RepID=UPI0030CCAD39